MRQSCGQYARAQLFPCDLHHDVAQVRATQTFSFASSVACAGLRCFDIREAVLLYCV